MKTSYILHQLNSLIDCSTPLIGITPLTLLLSLIMYKVKHPSISKSFDLIQQDAYMYESCNYGPTTYNMSLHPFSTMWREIRKSVTLSKTKAMATSFAWWKEQKVGFLYELIWKKWCSQQLSTIGWSGGRNPTGQSHK